MHAEKHYSINAQNALTHDCVASAPLPAYKN